ncbi:MAG: DUF4375 domain-containing protein [Terracidiphilus sp.]|jgi:hypothetical protein
MADLKWLDGYTGQTLEELLALADEYRVDSLLAAMEQALDRKAADVGEQDLSDEERIVLAVEALEREVNNGGYGQFFSNTSGQYTPIIVASLLHIGCPETANITSGAINALGTEDYSPEALDAALESENDERDEQLDECDGLYSGTGEDIAGQLFEFVRAHQDAIQL